MKNLKSLIAFTGGNELTIEVVPELHINGDQALEYRIGNYFYQTSNSYESDLVFTSMIKKINQTNYSGIRYFEIFGSLQVKGFKNIPTQAELKALDVACVNSDFCFKDNTLIPLMKIYDKDNLNSFSAYEYVKTKFVGLDLKSFNFSIYKYIHCIRLSFDVNNEVKGIIVEGVLKDSIAIDLGGRRCLINYFKILILKKL